MAEKVPQTDFALALKALTRTPENFRLLVKALKPLRPYLRGPVPKDLPFEFDERTVRNGLNFTLLTPIGGIDLLGEVAGGTYKDLLPYTHRVRGFDREFLAIDLDKLIELKRAAGRAKDHEAIAELEAIRQDQIASERQTRPSV